MKNQGKYISSFTKNQAFFTVFVEYVLQIYPHFYKFHL